MREDYFTNTEHDAGRYERMRARDDVDLDGPDPSEYDDVCGDDRCVRLHGHAGPHSFDRDGCPDG